MRIFTKSRYVFLPPVGVNDKPVHTPLKFFVDVPDWVKKDNLFQLGVKAGDIEVINSREKQLKVEAEATVQPVSPFASVSPFDNTTHVVPKAVPKAVPKVAPKTAREAEIEAAESPIAHAEPFVPVEPFVPAEPVVYAAPKVAVKAVPKMVRKPVLNKTEK